MIDRIKGLLETRYRISTQLYLGIGGAVALVIAASLVGWFSFNQVGDVQRRVNEGRVPEMVAAFRVAQHSNSLVAAAPRLASAVSAEDFAGVAASIDESHAALEQQLAVLEQADAGDERFARIRDHADALISNISAVKDGMSESFDLNKESDQLRVDLTAVRTKLGEILTPLIDEQIFYTITGHRLLGEGPAPREEHFSEEEFYRYYHLGLLQTNANIATELLANSYVVSDASLVEPLKERFESAQSRIERSFFALADTPFHAELSPVFSELFALESVLDLRARQLRLIEHQNDLLESNSDLANELLSEVEGLVSASSDSVQAATQASTQAIFTGRLLLLAIGLISIVGALIIVWLFVGRVVVSRIEMLSGWMRSMAGGDLETQVEIGGRDEVAEMAAALEVFRRHALEVQRLNLVEKLANELQGKNDELESVLADLRKAQDQIVMREKLAALGELTAGVAHEIKNPLNFVKNFSEASADLLEELNEVLSENGGELTPDDRDLIEEISEDLTGNLKRIHTHGERANRIVHDMLSMGRGAGGLEPTNLNNLLDEHARLAYHSKRAADTEFQLDLKQDLDPEMGEVEVIPQDMGRVFLNMVSNACDATDERRRTIEQADGSTDYSPTVWLSTKRGDETAVIRIRDNGAGIPPDVIERVFNPFFTTKPPDKGTGLGLAMSSDIVRHRGGTIRVKSEPGQFTEMTIEFPLEPVAIEEDADEAAVQAQ
ncbi:MAG: ATP-binding protein [Chloroflexota bacterium]|nr:ATP-binding protein [Chloroflexota bacterium]